jgi:hypothetical protein
MHDMSNVAIRRGVVWHYCALFVFIISVLALPYKKIGFDSDSCGMYAYIATIPSFKEALDSFRQDPIAYVVESPEEMVKEKERSKFYRPLNVPIDYGLYSLFSANAHALLISQVCIHALTTLCIYYLFCQFFEVLVAFLLAALFAFHPSLISSFIGLQCGQTPSYLLLALATIFFFRFRITRASSLYVLAALMHFIGLFSYEIGLVYPALIALYLGFFDLKNIVKDSALFFASNCAYLVIRHVIVGLSTNIEPSISFFEKAFGNWRDVTKFFWGTQSYSKYVTALVLALFALVLIFTFCRFKSRRRLLIFCVLAFFMASWPITLFLGESRYFYLAIPFFCILVYEAIWGVASLFPQKINILHGVLVALVAWEVVYAFRAMSDRSHITALRDEAFIKLGERLQAGNIRDLVLLSAPGSWNFHKFIGGVGVTRNFNLLFERVNFKIHHVAEMGFDAKNKNLNWHVTPIEGGFQFNSTDESNSFVMWPHHIKVGDDWEKGFYRFHVTQKQREWQMTGCSVTFDASWLKNLNLKSTLFAHWNGETHSFDIVDHWHLKQD